MDLLIAWRCGGVVVSTMAICLKQPVFHCEQIFRSNLINITDLLINFCMKMFLENVLDRQCFAFHYKHLMHMMTVVGNRQFTMDIIGLRAGLSGQKPYLRTWYSNVLTYFNVGPNFPKHLALHKLYSILNDQSLVIPHSLL